jgi:hypothetical protein
MAKPSKTVFTVGEAVVYFSGGPSSGVYLNLLIELMGFGGRTKTKKPCQQTGFTSIGWRGRRYTGPSFYLHRILCRWNIHVLSRAGVCRGDLMSRSSLPNCDYYRAIVLLAVVYPLHPNSSH